MKNLNRKKYKETIKSFRDTCPIAQLQHKWVYFKDQYKQDTLMFVHNSIIKRDKTAHAQWRGYEYDEFYFNVYLYGTPAIHVNYHGLDITHWESQCIMALKNTEYTILEGDDVISTFNKITEKNRRYHEYYFKKAMLKNTPNKSKNIS